MTIRPLVPVLLALLCPATPGHASGWISYDSWLGTLPPAQGWMLNEDIMPATPYGASIEEGALRLNTLAFGTNDPPNNGGGVWWSRSDTDLDFSADFAVEVRVRIASAPDHAVNPDEGWPRPGYTLTIIDTSNRFFWIGLGSGEVFLSNTPYGHYGSSDTVTLPFNTTDGYHVYRIERAAGGTGASLRIDGVVRLTLPLPGSIQGSGNLIYFGDPTYWANSDSYTSWVRYGADVAGVEAPTHRGSLWARALDSPSGGVRVAFGAEKGGRVSLVLFDPAGRRVAHAERELAGGQEGVLETDDRPRAGVYFYRLRLTGERGSGSEVTGRVVVVD